MGSALPGPVLPLGVEQSQLVHGVDGSAALLPHLNDGHCSAHLPSSDSSTTH